MTMAKAKPEPESDEHQLSLRVHPRVVERADALLDFLTEQTGRKCVRSDVLREALTRGLRILEALAAK